MTTTRNGELMLVGLDRSVVVCFREASVAQTAGALPLWSQLEPSAGQATIQGGDLGSQGGTWCCDAALVLHSAVEIGFGANVPGPISFGGQKIRLAPKLPTVAVTVSNASYTRLHVRALVVDAINQRWWWGQKWHKQPLKATQHASCTRTARRVLNQI